MRKLIEINQEYIITCDNCDFKIKNTPNHEISQYLNKPCPICNKNLLTEKDYNKYMILMNYLNWVNKWFSWITIFIPKNKKFKKFTADIHNSKIYS